MDVSFPGEEDAGDSQVGSHRPIWKGQVSIKSSVPQTSSALRCFCVCMCVCGGDMYA